MLKYLIIVLTFFFAVATAAGAQVIMPGAQPNPNFPQPTGPGNPQNIQAAYGACMSMVKQREHGMSLPQFLQGCMGSMGYSVLHGVDSCYAVPPVDGIGRKYPTREACLSSDNAYLPAGATYFPTPWQVRTPPVAYDPDAPGPKLLLLAKELADHGQLDDPAAVAGLLHLPLTHSTHKEDGAPTCSVPSDQGRDSSDVYTTAGNSWFHALPSGTKLIIDRQRVDFFPFAPRPPGPRYVPLGDPVFTYTITSNASCGSPSPRDGIGAEIIFDNIPAYACISDQLALQS